MLVTSEARLSVSLQPCMYNTNSYRATSSSTVIPRPSRPASSNSTSGNSSTTTRDCIGKSKERISKMQEEQAKQLDSVTDRVKDTELDASKAQQAMSALSTAKEEDDLNASAIAAIAVSKEDIALIVKELEVTEEVAEKQLKQVGFEHGTEKMLENALRQLIKS